jgi:hypothetical protein
MAVFFFRHFFAFSLTPLIKNVDVFGMMSVVDEKYCFSSSKVQMERAKADDFQRSAACSTALD